MKSTVGAPISLGEAVTLCGTDELRFRFEREIAPLRPELLRAAARLTRGGPDTEDLVQDAMLRGFRGIETLAPGTNARAWMHRILKNTFINNYRAAQRRPQEVLSDDTAEFVAGIAVGPAQEDGDVRDAMLALSDEYRTAVYLADVEGFSYAEIAEIMGTPLGTVMSRLYRARQQLRLALGGVARRRRLVAVA